MELLLSRILNYEKTIFDDYCLHREKMLEFITKIKINSLDNNQLLNFIECVKGIIDPLKTSTLNIENFINNEVNDNFNESQFILFYFLFGNRFFGSSIESVSELNEEPESIESSDSFEESES